MLRFFAADLPPPHLPPRTYFFFFCRGPRLIGIQTQGHPLHAYFRSTLKAVLSPGPPTPRIKPFHGQSCAAPPPCGAPRPPAPRPRHFRASSPPGPRSMRESPRPCARTMRASPRASQTAVRVPGVTCLFTAPSLTPSLPPPSPPRPPDGVSLRGEVTADRCTLYQFWLRPVNWACNREFRQCRDSVVIFFLAQTDSGRSRSGAPGKPRLRGATYQFA